MDYRQRGDEIRKIDIMRRDDFTNADAKAAEDKFRPLIDAIKQIECVDFWLEVTVIYGSDAIHIKITEPQYGGNSLESTLHSGVNIQNYTSIETCVEVNKEKNVEILFLREHAIQEIQNDEGKTRDVLYSRRSVFFEGIKVDEDKLRESLDI